VQRVVAAGPPPDIPLAPRDPDPEGHNLTPENLWPLKYESGDPYPYIRAVQQRIQLRTKSALAYLRDLERAIPVYTAVAKAIDATKHLGMVPKIFDREDPKIKGVLERSKGVIVGPLSKAEIDGVLKRAEEWEKEEKAAMEARAAAERDKAAAEASTGEGASAVKGTST
jgi:hypothetical protein